MYTFVYYCALCGCPLNSIYVDLEIGGLDSSFFPLGEDSASWLDSVRVLLLKPPPGTDCPFPACSPSSSSSRAYLTDPGHMTPDTPAIADGDYIQVPPCDRDPEDALGVYDFTKLPFPGVSFPVHSRCWQFLERFLPQDATVDDVHEALSTHWRENSPKLGKEDWRWDHDGRHMLEYAHGHYGVDERRSDSYFGVLEEWIVTDPGYEVDVAKLVAGLPKIDSGGGGDGGGDGEEGGAGRRGARDVFARLPAELLMSVLDHLCSDDIGVLQAASPTFAHNIPRSYFRMRVQRLGVLWELDGAKVEEGVDWREVLAAIERNEFGVLNGDVTARNRVRVWRVVDTLVQQVEREVVRRKGGEPPRGPETWCDYYDKRESGW